MNKPSEITHIVVAVDESEVARSAVWAALQVAYHAHARVTVLRVLPFADQGESAALKHLQRWVEADLPALDRMRPIGYAVVQGLPGVEIGRFAEHAHADLLVLGRKHRSRATRLLLGDTADAVARRSRIPCLFVPGHSRDLGHLLVAVDGSERGMAVLRGAHRLAKPDVLTVEPARADEPVALALATPLARSRRIRSEVHHAVGHDIEVRRGAVTEEILAAADERDPDVLVLGCHRGGPAGVIEAGSIAREVLHRAACAVLTIPL